MFKFLSSDTKESEKLFKQLEEIMAEEAGIKEEQKKLEPGMRKCFQRFVLNNACLNGPEAAAARFEGEALRAKKVNLQDTWYRKLVKVQLELQKITLPIIIDFCEVLMKELRNLNKAKVFRVLTDKESMEKEGGRIFEAEHNFFSVHKTQKEILAVIETIRGMELQPLISIRKIFDEAIAAIPDQFEMVTTLGNSQFRDWIFDNRPSDGSSINPEVTWLHLAKIEADLIKQQNILDYWQPVRSPNKDREVGKIVNKHILEVGLGTLMDSRK